jgi:hypothetical protein
MSLSYTYENNGWAFTNYFDGSIRITEMESRGTLREVVTIDELRDDIYLITWADEEMGPITQVVDFTPIEIEDSVSHKRAHAQVFLPGGSPLD